MARVSAWDLMFVVLFLVTFVSWNSARHEGAYHDMLVKLKKKHTTHPVDFNEIAKLEQQQLNSAQEEEEDSEEVKRKEAEQKRQHEEQAKEVLEKVKQERREELILIETSEKLREKYENGVNLEELNAAELAAEGTEEEEILFEQFKEDLASQVQKWSKQADILGQVKNIDRSRDTLTAEDQEVLRKAERQRKWVQLELDSMVMSMKSRKSSEIKKPLIALHKDDYIQEHTATEKKQQNGGSLRKPSTSTLNTLAPLPAVSGDNPYIELLEKIRVAIAPFQDESEREILVTGEKQYVGRDLPLYSTVYKSEGFKINKRKADLGKMTTKSFLLGEWKVMICLALDTSHCFVTHSMSKTRRNQRINRLMGLRQVLWSKDSFCNTVSNGIQENEEFAAYTFECWIFPQAYGKAHAYALEHPEESYIIKPLSKGGGMGISVVDGDKGLHKVRKQRHIVQTYLPNPYLINNRKWDMRTYVLLTSSYPIRMYLYNGGLTRFASREYDPTAKKGGKKSQFLTNTSVGKHFVKKGNVTSITWSFDKLEEHFVSNNLDYDMLLNRMEAAISVVFLSAELSWKKYFDTEIKGGNIKYCANCYQIMGVDLIVDSELQPRVIEVNGQPSMKFSDDHADHYSTTKQNMQRDVLNIMFSTDNIVPELSQLLMQLPQEQISALTRHEFEYLLEFTRESRHIGGFRKIYPNSNHYDFHTRFLEMHQLGEERMALHHLINKVDSYLNTNNNEGR